MKVEREGGCLVIFFGERERVVTGPRYDYPAINTPRSGSLVLVDFFSEVSKSK